MDDLRAPDADLLAGLTPARILDPVSGDVERWWSQRRGAQCDGKVRHPTERSAQQAARILELQTHQAFEVYRCDFCRRWHVGSAR